MKKLISLLLCFCLLASVLSIHAFAACSHAAGEVCDFCAWDFDDHTCSDGDADGLCDTCCGSMPHECVDEDGDYWCDECWEILPHICKDFDSDYCCDYCYGPVGHDCVDEDEDYWCDLCANIMDHDCIDEDMDAWCDLCDWFIEHDCYDEDADAWCDYCQYPMEHDCIDSDADSYCDICYLPTIHDCIDEDGDYYCDICEFPVEHNCVDLDIDTLCDICYEKILTTEFIVFRAFVESYMDDDAMTSLDVYDEEGTWIVTMYLPGNSASVKYSFRPGIYTYELNKYGHTPYSGEFIMGLGYPCRIEATLYPIGDATNDGRLNVGDTAQIYSHIRGTSVITDAYALECADASQDGKLNIGDAARVYSHVKQTSLLF